MQCLNVQAARRFHQGLACQLPSGRQLPSVMASPRNAEAQPPSSASSVAALSPPSLSAAAPNHSQSPSTASDEVVSKGEPCFEIDDGFLMPVYAAKQLELDARLSRHSAVRAAGRPFFFLTRLKSLTSHLHLQQPRGLASRLSRSRKTRLTQVPSHCSRKSVTVYSARSSNSKTTAHWIKLLARPL